LIITNKPYDSSINEKQTNDSVRYDEEIHIAQSIPVLSMKVKQIPQLDHFSSMSPSRYDTLVAVKHMHNKIEAPMDRRTTFRRKDCNSDVSLNTFLIDQR
jgi:hypothetical protein